MPNTSVQFNATNHQVQVPSDAALNTLLTGDYTVQFWMYKDSEAGDWQRMVGKGDGTNRTLGVWEEAGGGKRILYQIYVSGGSSLSFFSNSNVEVGRWYHITATKQGYTAKIYINGVLDAQTTFSGTILTDTQPLTFGLGSIHTGFPGRLDDVAPVQPRPERCGDPQPGRNGFLAAQHDLLKQGTGTLTLAAAARYTGNTTVNDGTLKLGASNVIPDGTGNGNVIVAGPGEVRSGRVQRDHQRPVPARPSGQHGRRHQLDADCRQPDATCTFDGVIQSTGGTLNLAKIGTGTLTLTGANTYNGLTDIRSGTIKLAGGPIACPPPRRCT